VHQFETDDIYKMWEDLRQLTDPAAVDAQLRKIGNYKFENFETCPSSMCTLRWWWTPRSSTIGPSRVGTVVTSATPGSSRHVNRRDRVCSSRNPGAPALGELVHGDGRGHGQSVCTVVKRRERTDVESVSDLVICHLVGEEEQYDGLFSHR